MLTKKFLVALFSLVFTGLALADTINLNPSHPDRYVVVEGDTLWDISGRFLRDPWRWPDIWYANPQIENPHLIYPGDVISLVYVDGQPRLQVSRGHPTVKLSPQVRAESLAGAIPTIPLEAIRQFLSRPMVVTEEEMKQAPYVVASAGEHVVSGAGDRIYVRGIQDPQQQTFVVVRPGRPYRNPPEKSDIFPVPFTDSLKRLVKDSANEEVQTTYKKADDPLGDVLGYDAVHVGDAVVDSYGDPSTLTLIRTTREARVGDLLFPTTEETIEPYFLPRAPDEQVDGQIVSIHDGVTQIGQYQVVILNLGKRDGMEPGHVLAVYAAGEEIRDTVSGNWRNTVKLPDERAGLVMVFRVYERASYALVMKATRAMHVLDLVRNP